MQREEFNTMMRKELANLGYKVDPKFDEIDIFWDCYDAIYYEYPNAILSLVKEWERNIAFYFKEHKNVVGNERQAFGISKEVLVKIE